MSHTNFTSNFRDPMSMVLTEEEEHAVSRLRAHGIGRGILAKGRRQTHLHHFVKMNDALCKVKRGLLRGSGDAGTMLHTFGACFLEAILFDVSILERRSVEHAGAEHITDAPHRRKSHFV